MYQWSAEGQSYLPVHREIQADENQHFFVEESVGRGRLSAHLLVVRESLWDSIFTGRFLACSHRGMEGLVVREPLLSSRSSGIQRSHPNRMEMHRFASCLSPIHESSQAPDKDRRRGVNKQNTLSLALLFSTTHVVLEAISAN